MKIPFSEVFGAFLGVLLGLIKCILLNSYTMKQYFSRLLLLFAFCILAVSCSDEDEGTEFLFDREIMELSVIQGCADENDTSACFSVRYRLPIDREDFAYIHVWIDTTVVDDTSKAVSSKQIDKATKSIDYSSGTERVYDTLDLTELVKDYVDQGYDSVQVALFCEYTDGDPGSVQRVFLHFGDDIPPSRVTVYDSVWTTGALFEWYRRG